jgi:hypothetical protein
VDVFIQPCGVLGRKNTAILKEIYLGKILYFLPKILQDKLKANIKIDDAKKLIYQVYDLLDPTEDKEILNSIKNKIEDIKPDIFKDSVIQDILHFNYILPPFTSPTFKDIQVAAKLLNIPLNEKVYIPELGTWTKTAVPVGIQYMSTMEQTSADYESTRSIAGYQSMTGQPTVNLLAALVLN